MKKCITMLMFMLAGCLFVSAQSDMSGDSMKKDKMQGSTMTGKKMSMTGCVAEKDGKFMMMNKAHPEGVQLMGSEDMKPHVGHKMSVTGMMEKMPADSMKSDDKMKDDKMAKDDKMKDDKMMKHDDMGMMEMKVTSMKMMSKQCDMSKMMSK